MGFKAPRKARKGARDPLEDDNTVERDLDPTKVVSGGGKVAKRRRAGASDAPKAFQHIMRFMEAKAQRDADKKKEKKQQQQKKSAKAPGKDEPRQVTEELTIMPGESMTEFNRRVREKMYNNLRLVGTEYEAKAAPSTNPSRDDGNVVPAASKRAEHQRAHNARRKERRQAKRRGGAGSSDDDEARRDSSAPRFGEQAQAPPVFRALPKARFKRAVPLPNTPEATAESKRREELAIKKMIQRTARLSPLERMQARRKLASAGDSAAEKRILEAERDRAVRRYRMLRAARDAAAAPPALQ
ncbi:hypothetical protein H4R18_003063 [Coemansia javaensis]|uniref:Uncharacterized protein n=1 Tax=Coemansia javaensis TaxID=2761396 RepID=A0A9W8LHW1_9FUNG|nr:hypothetical protein H4R18_003063 [Coemansia javaensis]